MKNPSGKCESSAQVTVIAKPTAPQGPLEVSEICGDGALLSWNPPEDDGGTELLGLFINLAFPLIPHVLTSNLLERFENQNCVLFLKENLFLLQIMLWKHKILTKKESLYQWVLSLLIKLNLELRV